MAHPRKHVSNGHPQKQNDLALLSTEVLRLCLQALNLTITVGKATLISRLNLVTGTKQPRLDLKFASQTCPDETFGTEKSAS